MSSLLTALREILLDDPASIEGLPARDAASLDRLLEANSLQPFLYDLVKKKGREGRLSPKRHIAWKNASLLSSARSIAFRAAFDEILGICAERGIPVRPLRSTQLSFFVYSSPDLRPIADLEIQTLPPRAAELLAALKSRRFFELEDLWDEGGEAESEHRLPTLERDGVTVKIHKRSIADLEEAPWDHFPLFRKASLPFLHSPETLAILLSLEITSRRFCHSLALLHDLHFMLERLEPNWKTLLGLVREKSISLEVSLPLLVLHEVLGLSLDDEILKAIDDRPVLPDGRRKVLIKCARTAALLYPASHRIASFLGAQIAQLKVAEKALLSKQ